MASSGTCRGHLSPRGTSRSPESGSSHCKGIDGESNHVRLRRCAPVPEFANFGQHRYEDCQEFVLSGSLRRSVDSRGVGPCGAAKIATGLVLATLGRIARPHIPGTSCRFEVSNRWVFVACHAILVAESMHPLGSIPCASTFTPCPATP